MPLTSCPCHCPGEAKPKHAFLLECLVDKWRTIQLPLGSVRPFMWDSLSLAAVAPPLDPEDMGALSAVLERKVCVRVCVGG